MADSSAVDAIGNPINFILTGSQSSEHNQADSLMDGFDACYVLAEKGYDSDVLQQDTID